MNHRTAISWMIASLPWIGLFCLFFEILQAVYHFGHIPEYMVDPDPFNIGWQFIFSGALVLPYFFLPLLILSWALLLSLPPLRYSGRHPALFYSYVAGMLIAIWLFTWYDVTGFISWRID